ncbi:Uncharacterised protein [Bacteroides xylanisolvens]|nr:Uncharacterised protein [Bacteroides xylanisolvens]
MDTERNELVEDPVRLVSDGRFPAFSLFACFLLLLFLCFYLNEFISQDRADKDGCHPGEEKGCCDDPEERRAVLRCLAFCHPDGDEARRRDERPGEHRLCTALIGRFRR